MELTKLHVGDEDDVDTDAGTKPSVGLCSSSRRETAAILSLMLVSRIVLSFLQQGNSYSWESWRQRGQTKNTVQVPRGEYVL